MPSNLCKIHQILDDLAKKIHYRGSLFTKEEDNLQLSQWEREQAYCWLHATDHYLPLMGRQGEVLVHQIDENLNHEKIKKPMSPQHSIHFGDLTIDSIPPALLSSIATDWYDTWFEQAGDIRRRSKTIIQYPKPHEKVLEYLYSLSAIALTQKSSKWRESLGSFLYFLRKKFRPEEKLQINELFPEYMEVSEDAIRRLIPNTAYPIEIDIAAQIVQGLVAHVKGRSNSQYTSAQALGIVWVSLSCAFAKVNPNEKFIHELTTVNLYSKEAFISEQRCKHYFLSLISPNGDAEIPISMFLYNYLMLLANVNNTSSKHSTLFTASLRSLRRRLASVAENGLVPASYGKITFLSFLNRPHENIDRRYQKHPD